MVVTSYQIEQELSRFDCFLSGLTEHTHLPHRIFELQLQLQNLNTDEVNGQRPAFMSFLNHLKDQPVRIQTTQPKLELTGYVLGVEFIQDIQDIAFSFMSAYNRISIKGQLANIKLETR